MNKKRKTVKIVIFLLVLSFIAAAVPAILLSDKHHKTKEREGFTQTELVLYEGHSKSVTLYNKNSEQGVLRSRDEEIAKVSATGQVTAVKAGETEIVAVLDKKEYFCKVTVKEPVSPVYYAKAEKEKEWILSQRLDNGLFVNRMAEEENVLLVNPYFSSEVANAILLSGADVNDVLCVKMYLDWYFERINIQEDYNGLKGTMYDYMEFLDEEGKVEKEQAYGQYDSTDSYAALFIITLYHYCVTTGDYDYIKEKEASFNLIFDAMFATMSDGYTITKPDYQLKYLMDNSEVYEGLKCAALIYQYVYEDEERTQKASEAYRTMKAYFDTLWWKDGYYSMHLNQNNEDYTEFDWDVFYPDAVSQLYPIIYGLADEEKATFLYHEFCEHFEWEKLDYYVGGEVDYYWGVVAYAAAVMGDGERFDRYIQTYEELSADRAYPLIASDSAWIMMAEYRMAQYYEELENF